MLELLKTMWPSACNRRTRNQTRSGPRLDVKASEAERKEVMAQTKPSNQTKPQTGTGMQHPEEYRSDLNPNANAGQNIGVAGTHPEKGARTAYEIKELHRQLNEMSDADLKQIPVMPMGSRLEQN